jgi:soluble lytic murein transglycosylase-like protein
MSSDMAHNNLFSIQQHSGHRMLENVKGYRRTAPKRLPVARQAQFKNILSAVQSSSLNRKYKTRGLTIADYRARPVISKSRFKAPPRLTINTIKKSALNRIPARSLSAALAKNSPPQSQAGAKTSEAVKKSLPENQPVRSRLTERDRIEECIQKAAAKYSLPIGLITAVVRAESNFQANAVSRAGAKGLMQLMPATAKDLGVTDIFDIEQNIDGGSKYLRWMLDRFGGNVRKALAAYNAGPGAVIKYNGQVPYPETRQYVNRVLRFTKQST